MVNSQLASGHWRLYNLAVTTHRILTLILVAGLCLIQTIPSQDLDTLAEEELYTEFYGDPFGVDSRVSLPVHSENELSLEHISCPEVTREAITLYNWFWEIVADFVVFTCPSYTVRYIVSESRTWHRVDLVVLPPLTLYTGFNWGMSPQEVLIATDVFAESMYIRRMRREDNSIILYTDSDYIMFEFDDIGLARLILALEANGAWVSEIPDQVHGE